MRYLTFDSQLACYVVKQGARQKVLTTRGHRLIMLEGEDVLAWAAEYRVRLSRFERRGWAGRRTSS